MQTDLDRMLERLRETYSTRQAHTLERQQIAAQIVRSTWKTSDATSASDWFKQNESDTGISYSYAQRCRQAIEDDITFDKVSVRDYETYRGIAKRKGNEIAAEGKRHLLAGRREAFAEWAKAHRKVAPPVCMVKGCDWKVTDGPGALVGTPDEGYMCPIHARHYGTLAVDAAVRAQAATLKNSKADGKVAKLSERAERARKRQENAEAKLADAKRKAENDPRTVLAENVLADSE